MAELKPCPFCGCDEVYVVNPDFGMIQWCGDDWKKAEVCCPNCGVGATFRLLHKSTENSDVTLIAEAGWNSRVPQTVVNQNGENCTNITNCGTLNFSL